MTRSTFRWRTPTDLTRFATVVWRGDRVRDDRAHLRAGRVLAEIERVLEPDGLLIMSTPDRRAYSDATAVETHSTSTSSSSEGIHCRTRGRRVRERGDLGSANDHRIGARGAGRDRSDRAAWVDGTGSPARTFFIERVEDDVAAAPALSPLYLVAVASKRTVPAVPSQSTLADCGVELERSAQAASASAATSELAQARVELSRLQAELEECRRAEHQATQRLADRAARGQARSRPDR